MSNRIICVYCNLHFTSVTLCQKHINQTHVICTKCPKCHKPKRGLYIDFWNFHVLKAHRFACSKCNLKFIRKRALFKHSVK